MRQKYSTLSERSKTPATCCTHVCNFFSSFWLQIFNFLDFAVGCIFFSFGIYVKFVLPNDGTLEEQQALLLIGWVSFILGFLFLLVAMFSFCGIVSNSCRFAVIPSGYVALLLALVSLSAGIAAVVCDDEILGFIDANQNKLNLKPGHVEAIHIFYEIICVVFFISFAIEIIRFLLSSQFAATSNLLDIGDIETESLLRNNSRSTDRYQADPEPGREDSLRNQGMRGHESHSRDFGASKDFQNSRYKSSSYRDTRPL